MHSNKHKYRNGFIMCFSRLNDTVKKLRETLKGAQLKRSQTCGGMDGGVTLNDTRRNSLDKFWVYDSNLQ